jgi:hypothetical protein
MATTDKPRKTSTQRPLPVPVLAERRPGDLDAVRRQLGWGLMESVHKQASR